MSLVRAIALAALASFAAFETACSSSGTEPAVASERQAEATPNLPKDVVPAVQPPKENALILHAGADRSESWAEFISLQVSSDQVYLEELDHRYFGVLSFRSKDERDYMLRSGFPTPEEWLAAKRMTDAELQELADAGNSKVAGILADRMSVRLEALISLDEEHPEDVGDDDRALVAATAVAYATRAMQGSASPFGVYVEGMVKSSIFDSWEPMTAAMLEGMRRGDPRANRLIEELHARHPVQDISAIHASLKGMTKDRP